MTISELLAHDLSGNIAVIGYAASGKSYISELLPRHDHLIHTDFHIGYPDDVIGILSMGSYIVEGIMCYELLGHHLFTPDIVIEVEAPRHQRERIYRHEREAEKLKYIPKFDRKCQSLLNEYHLTVKPDDKPIWYTVENTFDYAPEK